MTPLEYWETRGRADAQMLLDSEPGRRPSEMLDSGPAVGYADGWNAEIRARGASWRWRRCHGHGRFGECWCEVCDDWREHLECVAT